VKRKAYRIPVNLRKHQQTGAPDNGIVEVTGSIPVGSTNRMQGLVGLTANPFIVP